MNPEYRRKLTGIYLRIFLSKATLEDVFTHFFYTKITLNWVEKTTQLAAQ